MMDKLVYEVEIELSRFGIKNDGTSPEETSNGINRALDYAKGQGFSKIVFPKGTYLIHETNPIVIDLKNTVIDLNGSTLLINTNGLEKYSIVEFRDGAENVRFTNGSVRGDKDTHDYFTVKSPHEWGCGIVFRSGKNLQIDNITVSDVTGYGIYTENGVGANRFHTLYNKDVNQGAISDDGNIVESTIVSRTAKPYDVSVCGGQFELGYTLGYQGYPYLLNAEYTSYFYDNDMKFLQKKECIQFRKVDIPESAKYVHFVFPQSRVLGNVNGTYAWITNLKPPTNVKLTDCLLKENRSLGLAFCGGQQWVIENNIFEANGGNAPNLAVDFEDGWELMQDVIFRNNKFINNNADLVVSAGDNLVFEGNEIQNGAYFWERTTNYKVIGNKFNGSSVTYKTKRTGCEVRDNEYKNTAVSTISLSPLVITLANETLLDCQLNRAISTGAKLINCIIKATGKPYMKNASMENCTIEVVDSEAFNLILKNCKLKNTHFNLHTEHSFENCEIKGSTFSTHSDTSRIQFKGSHLVNSQMLYSTWGAATEAVFEQCKITMDTNLPPVRLSAGKTRDLIFKNNTVINETAKPVIELYDALYTEPNGNATIEGNSFTQTKYGYVFDGVKITKGIFKFTERNNNITGATMINPKYMENPYFVITSE